jgi:hypothetical protein
MLAECPLVPYSESNSTCKNFTFIMDIRPEVSIRTEIGEIEAIPIAQKTKRLNAEIRRRHPELQGKSIFPFHFLTID